MRSQPRAAFCPIPHDLDIAELIENQPNFEAVTCISYADLAAQDAAQFENLVRSFVIKGGKPIVISGYDEVLDPWVFKPGWLIDNLGDTQLDARDQNKRTNMPLTLAHYLKYMPSVTNQHFRSPGANDGSVKVKEPQRIYLKDIDCPEVWRSKLKEHLPPFLTYLNESTGDMGGLGAAVDPNSNTPGHRRGPGAAHAGDLMSSLPPDMRAENMQCYIGHEGTYTPAHREMCATLGHNIMVEASSSTGEGGKPEHPGSSIWFMTESHDRHTVAEYWLSRLGHDIETEHHFASIQAWKQAPFSVHIVEQKPGDLILIPPLAPHQVWNRGTRTMKAAWNRTTAQTLQLAMHEALPKARMVCRDEQYKNKAIIYHTLQNYSQRLKKAVEDTKDLPPHDAHDIMGDGKKTNTKIRDLRRDFETLLGLFRDILLSEMWDPTSPQPECEYLPFDSNVTCAYCRCNIFNRFLSCPTCDKDLDTEQPEPYDVCMDCYVMGRSCYCLSGHKWVEQFKWDYLEAKYEEWRDQHNDLQASYRRKGHHNIPLTLQDQQRAMTKRTLAEVCRVQLIRRPFQDPKKPKDQQLLHCDGDDAEDGEEIVIDDEGRVKKTVKKRPKDFFKHHSQCHICKNPQPNWKMVMCTSKDCSRYYCLSTLYRGNDKMPMEIMEDKNWVCPHCEGICFGGSCAKLDTQNPIAPKGSRIGHDTRAIADIRSVETLVDFSVSNVHWLKPIDEDQESEQIMRAKDAAEQARLALNSDIFEDGDFDTVNDGQPQPENVIDPALQDESMMAETLTRFNATLDPELADDAREIDTVDGYVPAATAGFSHGQDVSSADGTYDDPSELATGANHPFAGHESSQKRSRDEDESIVMEAPKNKKYRPSVGGGNKTSEAARQYETAKTKKLLETARLQGRYIATKSRLTGRSLVVKLAVAPAELASITNKPPQEREGGSNDELDDVDGDPNILRSDLNTPKSQAAAKIAAITKRQSKAKVASHLSTGIRRSRKSQVTEIDSDEDDEVDEADEGDVPEKQPTTGRGERRISKYLESKYGDEADKLEVLPDVVHTRTKRTRQSEPARTRSRSRSRGPSARTTSMRASTGRHGLEREPTIEISSPAAPTAPMMPPEKSVTEEELNRQAKLEALKALDDDHDQDQDEDGSEDRNGSTRGAAAKVDGHHNGAPRSRKSTAPRMSKGPTTTAPIAPMAVMGGSGSASDTPTKNFAAARGQGIRERGNGRKKITIGARPVVRP